MDYAEESGWKDMNMSRSTRSLHEDAASSEKTTYIYDVAKIGGAN